MIHILGRGYQAPFEGHGDINYSPGYGKGDVIVFTGGHDVSPSLYGQTEHPQTHSFWERDEQEREVFYTAAMQGIPMVGICRGSQFLNVMNGGTLIQHQTEHAGSPHMMYTRTEMLEVTSTHHQMAVLPDEAELIGWAYECKDESWVEPEVWWFASTRCLCVQYHPEYMTEDSRGWEFFQELLNKYIF